MPEMMRLASELNVSRLKVSADGFEVEFFKKAGTPSAPVDDEADEADEEPGLKKGAEAPFGLSDDAIKTLLDPYHS